MTPRRDALQACKQTTAPAGVFAIRNDRTGRALVGGSVNVAAALNRQRFELEHGTHRNKALLADWKALGAENFSFTALDTVEPRDDPAFDRAAELKAMLALWLGEHRRLGAQSY